jgi:hypothetical protein
VLQIFPSFAEIVIISIFYSALWYSLALALKMAHGTRCTLA